MWILCSQPFWEEHKGHKGMGFVLFPAVPLAPKILMRRSYSVGGNEWMNEWLWGDKFGVVGEKCKALKRKDEMQRELEGEAGGQETPRGAGWRAVRQPVAPWARGSERCRSGFHWALPPADIRTLSFLKAFIEFVTILLLFYVLIFEMWDLISSIRVRTCSPCIGMWSLNHWTTRVVPQNPLIIKSSEVYVPPYTVEWGFSFREWRQILCPPHDWHLLRADPPSSTRPNLGDPDTQVYPPGLWVTAAPGTLGPVLQGGVL